MPRRWLSALLLAPATGGLAVLDESRLQIFFWNEAQGAWEAIPTTVDPVANTLTIQLEHLTLFAVLQTVPQEKNLYLPNVSR